MPVCFDSKSCILVRMVVLVLEHEAPAVFVYVLVKQQERVISQNDFALKIKGPFSIDLFVSNIWFKLLVSLSH